MRNFVKTMALCLALLLCISCPVTASATIIPNEDIINMEREGSLTLYKYDLSGAEKDNVWDSSYVSTGVYDQDVNDTLGNGYAVEGVEFTYRKVADIVQYSDAESGTAAGNDVEVLYAVDKTAGADFLKALGLTDGTSRFEKADQLDTSKYFYTSDVLIKALEDALAANSTAVKNALEAYAAEGGTAMPLTDEYGKSEATGLELGLYLLAETKIPNRITETCDPALISLPMTSVNGTNAANGGDTWLYDPVLYPKNRTGLVTLEKTLRENKADTGDHNGSTTDIADGYAHNGTASNGDIIDYQIISTLPAITSASTYLSDYTFTDTLSKGLGYVKQDVVLEFFSDAACTASAAKWTEADGKFSVAYGTTEAGDSTMTITMTETGLSEINTSKAVYTEDTMTNSGYSGCTVRVTYQAKLNSNDTVVYGDKGNPNCVELKWKRTTSETYDTLQDDCHLNTYGLELTKLFSDDNGDYSQVEFTIYNKTDDYYVKANLDEATGIYYVSGHVAKNEATKFVPAADTGKILVKGLEDDEYILTETKTDSGYALLKNAITVVISQKEADAVCSLSAQAEQEHNTLTASATVDGKAVNMLEDNGSVNAEAPLRVINTKGFNLPQTGDRGVWMYGVAGVLLMTASIASIYFTCRKKKSER